RRRVSMSAPSVLRWSMPRTALVTGNVGSSSCARPSERRRRPPGYPVYRVYSLLAGFVPVTFTCAALITITWSPEFRCGVYVGLCLPFRIFATLDARRPSTRSVASTTNHSLFRSAAFAVQVFCFANSSSLVNHFHQGETARRRRPGGQLAITRKE